MEMQAQEIETRSSQLSAVVIALCKGVIDRESESRLWQLLLNKQMMVSEYVEVLNLELILDEAEGYAFLRGRESSVEEDRLPRLIARRQLSFHVSLLLALLREKMAEFDASGGGTRVIVSRDEVVEMIRVFLPEGGNEVRLVDQVDSYLNQVVKMGFARRLKGVEQMFELRRIIKSFIDAQWLAEFDQRLSDYRKLLQSEDGVS